MDKSGPLSKRELILAGASFLVEGGISFLLDANILGSVALLIIGSAFLIASFFQKAKPKSDS